MAPPLSIAGVIESLRWPTARDLVFSLKAYLAAALSLLIGFSQNLENPYWSVLTVYIVLMQTETGAIRSKAVFRLIGTVGGALLVMVWVGLFADQLGVLLAVTIATIVAAVYLRGIDRTPANYIWFSGGLTAGFIGLVDLQTPLAVFDIATARMAEILIGILVMSIVDSLIWPSAMKPAFLESIDDWRAQARSWVVDGLAATHPRAPDPQRRVATRERLRKLTQTVMAIDARAVQLPYDAVDVPPRGRDLDLLRRTITHLITDLASIEEWARAMRHSHAAGPALDPLLDRIAAWVRDEDRLEARDADAYAAEATRIREAIDATARSLNIRTDEGRLVERGMLTPLGLFVGDWADLALTMRAVATRADLPPGLERLAKDAAPVRSVDYFATLRDVLPMALSLTLAAVLYYLTAWPSGPTAMLFAFIGCAFLIGQPGLLRSGIGISCWVGGAFVIVFAYQFAVLPRVTTFPTLIAVFGVVLIPLGLMLTMTLAGLLMAVFAFAFLGLQSTYSGDFESSLLSLGGAASGLLLAILCLHVCSYDKPRYTIRRLQRALRLDVADAATAVPVPGRERFLQLTIDRLGQYFVAAGQLGDDPLTRLDLINDLRIGLGILRLRGERAALPAGTRAAIDALLARIAASFRARAGEDTACAAFQDRFEPLLARLSAEVADRDLHERVATLLTGLKIALAADASPFAEPAVAVDAVAVDGRAGLAGEPA